MKHGLAKYNAGCRCDLCKQASSEYHKAWRRRKAEEAGTFAAPGLHLLKADAPTSANAPVDAPFMAANMVEAAVSQEIASLGDHHRPGLEATALALGRLINNPKSDFYAAGGGEGVGGDSGNAV